MSKKSKKANKGMKYVDPYAQAMNRAKDDIENADYSINEVELDANGDPIEPEYEYVEKKPKRKEVLTPGYMEYLMEEVKGQKKKKKKEIASEDGDYDLDFINADNSEINVDDALKQVVKQANKDYGFDKKEPKEEDSVVDEQDLFPGEFHTEDSYEGMDDDGFFGNPLDYEDESDVEDADTPTASDNFSIGVGKVEMDEGEPDENRPAPKKEIYEDVEPVKVVENENESPLDYFTLSKICSLKFTNLADLGRLNISDGIVVTPVINSVLNLECFDVNQDRVYNYFLDENGKLDMQLLERTKNAIWIYIISCKHPAVIYTELEFVDAFNDVSSVDSKNFILIADEMDDTHEKFIYGYHVPAVEQRTFNNYINHAITGFTNDEEFYPGLPDNQRDALATFVVYCNIAITLANEREIFPRYLSKYVDSYRYATIVRNGNKYPLYNRFMEYTDLVHAHRKTVTSETAMTFGKLDEIFDVYDCESVRINGLQILDLFSYDYEDEEEEDPIDYSSEMQEEDSDDEVETVEAESVVEDGYDNDDVMDELAKQASGYVDDETDYTAMLGASQVEENIDDLSSQLYEQYVKTAKEQGEEVMTKEQLASRMKKNVTGAMMSSMVVEETPEVEGVDPAVKEQPSDNVGSNAMREALLRCGAKPSTTTKKPIEKKNGSMIVPVVRK